MSRDGEAFQEPSERGGLGGPGEDGGCGGPPGRECNLSRACEEKRQLERFRRPERGAGAEMPEAGKM